MTLATQDFTTLVTNQVAAIQTSAGQSLDFGIGSILRAVVEANSGVMLWLQGLILKVLSITRAATSQNADLDSWVADYHLSRIAGVQATGAVTFARFTTGQTALIPLGQAIQTGDGSQTFTVTEDDTNTYWNTGQQGYLIPTNVANWTVPVIATTVGVAGNISAGTLTVIQQSIPHIDTVTNALAFSGGIDPETDAALRSRFVLYITSLSKGIADAVGFAILSLQSNLTYSLVENYQYNGDYAPGYFYVVVDDGTGAPSSGLLDQVRTAINAVRALCTTFGVFAPVVVPVDISLTVTAAPGYTAATVRAAVSAILAMYANSMTLGQALTLSQVIVLAHGVDGVWNVTALSLNGGAADIAVTNQQVIKAGTITIS